MIRLLDDPVVEDIGLIKDFCSNSADVWQIVGYFLLVFKIVIPLIIIILGMLDLGKAVVASDEKAIQKSAKALLMRVIAGVLIFFVPTIVGLIFDLVSSFKNEVKNQYVVCRSCVVSPTRDGCKNAVKCKDAIEEYGEGSQQATSACQATATQQKQNN